MNQDIKKLWVAALRSGEYKQGHEALRHDARDGSGSTFCCLGVLCDVHSKNAPSPLDWNETNFNGIVGMHVSAYGGEEAFLPEDVMLWAGLKMPDPVLSIYGTIRPLSEHNDGNKEGEDERDAATFTEIADAIESQL